MADAAHERRADHAGQHAARRRHPDGRRQGCGGTLASSFGKAASWLIARRYTGAAMTRIRTSLAVFAAFSALAVVPLRGQPPKPKHINRAIELLEAGQPIYYTGSHSGTEGTFEAGKADAQTYADYISYDMEHAPYDVKGLADYMKGLVAGGPTKSGHRTPAVIVNVPVN